MLNIAVCDDAVLELRQLEMQIKRYAGGRPELTISCTSFQSSEELLTRVRKGAYHIYLLDIIMDGKDGIAVGNAIRSVDEEAVIIYTTVSPDYAIESYTVAAFYYLLKPVEDNKLFPVLDKAAKRFLLKPEGYISIRTADATRSVPISSIVLIEYHYHCLSYYLEQGEIITSLTFRESFDHVSRPLLENVFFQKVSSSYIVNLTHMDAVTKRGFLMKNGTEVNVTRLYSDAKKRYAQFVMRGGRQK